MKKILICDDSIAEVKLMQSVLEKAGYWPVVTHDAMQVEQMIDAQRPILILLDVVMPQRNGFQVWRDLKNSAELNSSHVVVVSSKDKVREVFCVDEYSTEG